MVSGKPQIQGHWAEDVEADSQVSVQFNERRLPTVRAKLKTDALGYTWVTDGLGVERWGEL